MKELKDLVEVILRLNKIENIMYTLFLLMGLLITKTDLLIFCNIEYSYPKEIGITTIFNYILSGQFLAPIFLFLINIIFLHHVKSVAHLIQYWMNTRSNKFKDILDFIDKVGVKFKWFKKINGKYIKDENYEYFIFFIQQCQDKDEVVFGKIKLLDTILLSLSISIWITPTGLIFKSICFLISFLSWLYMSYNIQFLYKVQDQLDEYLKIKNEIDSLN